jgi:FtsP/CotA-like multicopper oxidase with cupredoxin domain
LKRLAAADIAKPVLRTSLRVNFLTFPNLTVARNLGAFIALFLIASASSAEPTQRTLSPHPQAKHWARFTTTRARAIAPRRDIAPAPGPALFAETFNGTATQPNLWQATGNTCLTAGTTATPATSVPACNPSAPADANGSGTIQLTSAAQGQNGMLVYRTPFTTAYGLQVVFTDYAYDGTSPGGDGLAMFFADASLQIPTAEGTLLGSLGYAVPSAYLGVGYDEFGNFSAYGNGGSGNGFPGHIPETVAVRGAASSGFQYLAGVTNASGNAASLPFPIDSTSTTRPTNAPTFRTTLTAAGEVIVEIDHHDGNGFVTYLDKKTVGLSGQPAMPAQLYLAFSSTTGSLDNVHQIGNLTVSYLAKPQSVFTPAQIPNLAAWYDASDAGTIAGTAGAVSSWKDKSGNGNTLTQSATAAMPRIGNAIDGLDVLTFEGTQFFTSNNTAFSKLLLNESTVFAVTNQSKIAQNSSILSSGLIGESTPVYALRLSSGAKTEYDFNNAAAGRLTATNVVTGPAFWTAAGSNSTSKEYLRKDGVTLESSTGPGASAVSSQPLVVGANRSTSSSNPIYDYQGQIGEVLVFNRYLTTPEATEVEGYLACKWGMQNRLPASHPYRYVCPGLPANAPLPIASAGPAALVEPPEAVSSGGLLTVNVTAEQNASTGNPELVYNGSPVAPTIRLLPGDVMTVNLTNNLPTPPNGAGYLNDTNLHFHGLHVSPNAPSDDSIDLIALPGQSVQYKIAIPTNHPPGLYWYHSHAHGEAERQNLAGMSGALIIDGIGQYLPQLTHMPERVLIARDAPTSGQSLPDANRKQVQAMFWAMRHANTAKAHASAASMPGMHMGSTSAQMTMGDAIEVRGKTTAATRNPYVLLDPKYRQLSRTRFDADGHCTGNETAAKSLTLNGAAQPSIAIKPGERQFWRMVNAGSDTYLDIQLDNTQIQIVSIDGVPISSGVNTPQYLNVPDYILPPASRVEFIATGPSSGSTAYLRTLCYDAGPTGDAMPAAILASINSATSPTDDLRLRHLQRSAPKLVKYQFPRVLRAEPHQNGMRAMVGMKPMPAMTTAERIAEARRIGAQTIARTQTITYSDQYTINGVAYNPSAQPMFYAQSGTVEEWTIVNNSSQVHTFHIHQIHFLVEAVNGVTQSQEYVMDNANVPPATAAGPGTLKILLDFTDPRIIGTFLFHCHILSHEDAGMMAKIRVGTQPPLSVSPTSLTFATGSSPSKTATVSGGQAPYSITGCAGVANAGVGGTTVTVSPSGQGSCVLTLSDSAGMSASISVTVTAPASPVKISPNSLSFVAANSAAQSATITGGTAPYTVSGCSGLANGAVNAGENGVVVTPLAAGSCSLTITDEAGNVATLAVTINSATGAHPGDNLTFHHDPGRTGWDPNETALTTTNVASSAFGLLGTISAPSGMPAFGKVFAQPLYVTSETTSGGQVHNLVVIATTTDQVYAVDDRSGAVVWEHNFTNPAGGITQQSWTDTNCSAINPDIGIVATPVIDRTKDLLYVLVPTKENGVFHRRLHALALSSGADAIAPVEATATVTLASGGTATVDPKENLSRPALLEANGNIYIGLGSFCDEFSTTIHGWLLSYNASTLQFSGNAVDTTNLATGSNYFLGSLWMSGFGPAADSSGNVYVATGNGPYDGKNDFAMSVLKLPGNLDTSKASTFTPIGEAADSNSDADLGSGGVMVAPPLAGAYPHLVIQGGKCGVGSANGGTQGCVKYVLNGDNLGGQQAGDAGALYHANTGGSMFGGPAFFQDSSGKSYVIYGGGNPLTTYTLDLNPISLVPQSEANVGCLGCRAPGSQPIVSSNGTTAGTAIVWALKTPGNSGGAISLYAFDALNMSHTLYTGTAGQWTNTSGAPYIGNAFVSPLVANGRVYVPTDGGVAVFGLNP